MKTIGKLLSAVAMGAALVLFTGCASIVSGRHQEMSFKSSPDDALVTIDGRAIGKTPITIQVERKNSVQVVTIQKQGYKPETIQLKSSVNGWLFGNFILFGYCFFGSTTDSVTGAAFAYSQDMYSVPLNPIDGSAPSENAEIKTYVITNYKSITEELNTKPDQYLKALFTLLKVKPEQEADFTKKIKTLADENKDIVGFADKVAALTPQ